MDENKIYNNTLNEIPSNKCASCTLYVVLFAVFLTTSLIIGSVFVYFYWYPNKNIVQKYFKKVMLVLGLMHLKKQIVK